MAKLFTTQQCMCGVKHLAVKFFHCEEHNDTFGLCEDCAQMFEDPQLRLGADTLGAFVAVIASWFEEHKDCSINFGPDRMPIAARLELDIPITQFMQTSGNQKLLKN